MLPFALNSMTPSSVQKRIRVIAFTITLIRSGPVRASFHAVGSLP
jgi:hypothetical protein